MAKFFKSTAFRVLLSVVVYFVCADYLPLFVHRSVYTASVLIKDLIMLFMPFVVFTFVACAIVSFKKKSTLLLSVLFMFMLFTGFTGTWYSLFFAKLISNYVTFLNMHDKVSYLLEPIFTLPIQRPSWWSADKACFVGIVVGSIFTVYDDGGSLIKILERARQSIHYCLVHFVGKLVPIFVLGFIAQIYESHVIESVFARYITVILWLILVLVSYSVIIAFISAKGNPKTAWKYVCNILQPAMIAATSGSSLLAMPWTISGVEKNLQDPKLSGVVIPITTNMQMVGDCILNAFLCFFIYANSYGNDPSFGMLFEFSAIFIIMRFCGSAIMGGTIFLMLPLYEMYLHFTSDMLFLVLALNVLLDPVDGFFNVLTNGLLCKVFELIWSVVQYSKSVVIQRILPFVVFVVIISIFGVIMITSSNFSNNGNIKPPLAQEIEHKVTVHGETLVDKYHWLRDINWPLVSSPSILSYIDDENKYADSVLHKNLDLQNKIYGELLGRINEDDVSVPYRDGNYFYYYKIRKGQQYWALVRKVIVGNGDIMEPMDILLWHNSPEQVILDPNDIAATLGAGHYLSTNVVVSPQHDMLSLSLDTHGDERFTITVKNISASGTLNAQESISQANAINTKGVEGASDTSCVTGHCNVDYLTNTMPGVVWHENNEGFFYISAGDNWRADKVYYHRIGTTQKDDVLVYHETDKEYSANITKSESKRYLFIEVTSKENNEIWYIDLLQHELKPHLIIARRDNTIYHVTHNGEVFYVLTNDRDENFRLVTIPISTLSDVTKWVEIIPPSSDEYLSDMYMYRQHLVLLTKRDGLKKIKVFTVLDSSTENYHNIIKFEKEVLFPDDAYDTGILYTTFDAPAVRYHYSSLRAPYSIRELSFTSYTEKLLKIENMPTEFNSEDYVVERIWADNKQDNVKIPVSIVYKKNLFKADGTNPALIYGYGSYGISVPANFNKHIFSLLDRGFVYAIAHVRGGDDMGLKWYKDAKFLHKKRTFDDFICVTECLISGLYCRSGNIAIMGGSAGGMLVGSVVNMRPALFKTALAIVPFVDVLNTMLDDALPLTPLEYLEWGNPAKSKDIFLYMRSYSPYENITARSYPNIFVRAGITDPRVTYWEAAKYVAKLRSTKKDDNLLLLKTNTGAGHYGTSGRLNRLKEIAEEYAFILYTFGITK